MFNNDFNDLAHTPGKKSSWAQNFCHQRQDLADVLTLSYQQCAKGRRGHRRSLQIFRFEELCDNARSPELETRLSLHISHMKLHEDYSGKVIIGQHDT